MSNEKDYNSWFISEWIRRRKAQKITQTEMGRLIGKSRDTVARLESGVQKITLSTAERICQTLGINLTIYPPQGCFKCPNCHKGFETEAELKRHFSDNPVCDDYAQYLLAKVKYDFEPIED